MNDSRLIIVRLTGRPPVQINEDEWPVIASSGDEWYDTVHPQQANRETRWRLIVRQAKDGRTLVYATYRHISQFQMERDYSCFAGELLDVDASMHRICETIANVAETISGYEHYGQDASRWTLLREHCIADLPAEQLSGSSPEQA